MAAPLVPLGFETNRSRRKWVRDTGELLQLIFLEKAYGRYYLQWGLVCPELAELTWGVPYKTFDIGQAILTGRPANIRWPAKVSHFSDGELEASPDDIAARVREDVDVVTEWLEPLVTRRALREYLMENRERSDPRPPIRWGLSLKLIIAAGLALVDGDPVGCDLMVEARAASEPLDTVSSARLAGLRELATGVCDVTLD